MLCLGHAFVSHELKAIQVLESSQFSHVILLFLIFFILIPLYAIYYAQSSRVSVYSSSETQSICKPSAAALLLIFILIASSYWCVRACVRSDNINYIIMFVKIDLLSVINGYLFNMYIYRVHDSSTYLYNTCIQDIIINIIQKQAREELRQNDMQDDVFCFFSYFSFYNIN
uniref:Transmembrane protein n=1 Tax=Lepeophtheirus salmonis TaxID=72036 RepID=A0A0K2T5Q6_LEPSM